MNTDNILVRQAEQAQAPQAAKLLMEYQKFYAFNQTLSDTQAFVETRIKQQDATILLAFHKAQSSAVGIAQLYPLYSSMGFGKIIVLQDLFVTENYRHQGVGRALLNAVVDHAKSENAIRIDLKTEFDNTLARKVYEKFGFQLDEKYVRYTLKIGQ